MKISLCNIVKDDSEFKSWVEMVKSVAPYVDELCIQSNGKKVDKISQYCKEHGFKYQHIDWNDNFSDQRNANFNMANDADYILWLDTDDTLIGGQYLRELANLAKSQDYDTVFFQYWYGCRFVGKPSEENLADVELYHYRERLIRPGRIVWKKRIHETPVPIEGAKYKYNRINHLPTNPDKLFPIAVMHRGADRAIDNESLNKRMLRNQKLLELELKDEGNNPDPRTILYLMKIYTEMDDPKLWLKVLLMGKEYLERSGWDEERASCLMEMAKAFGFRGENEAAVKMLHKAVEEFPYNPLLYLMLALAYFNLGNYHKMEHWFKYAMSLDLDEKSSSMQNILQMKLMAAQLALKLEYIVKRDIKKAYQAAKTLYYIEPTEETKKTLEEIEKLYELNEACANVDKLVEFYDKSGNDKAIIELLKGLPWSIAQRPFVFRLKNKHLPPRKWADNEICYYANFGQNHFEQWSPKSMVKGIGGSETAVIELSRRIAKMGYKVVVYGDPGIDTGNYENVEYRPFYEFNPKDYFNIFIQWRSNFLAGRIKCKKYYVDLHDVWSGVDFDAEKIDKIMVKSKYHRDFAKNIPDNKFEIVSNGI